MMLRTAVLVIVAAVLCPLSEFAKRKAPARVPPVAWQGFEYRAPLDAAHMGHVQAFELSSGRKVWETKVYPVWIMPLVEEDVQWVFVSGMKVQGQKLVVRNERGKIFRLDLKTGHVEGLVGYWLPWSLAALFLLAGFLVWIRKSHAQQSRSAA